MDRRLLVLFGLVAVVGALGLADWGDATEVEVRPAPLIAPARIPTDECPSALARSRGFTPPAPGLGALEFLYGGGDVLNGQSTFQSATGSNSTNLDMWFREQHIGRVIDGYTRMYVLLGDGWDAADSGMAYQFYSPTEHHRSGSARAVASL